jgi:hypothetical protein
VVASSLSLFAITKESQLARGEGKRSHVQRAFIGKLRALLDKLEAQFWLVAHQPLDRFVGVLALVLDDVDGKLSASWERLRLWVPKFNTSVRAGASLGFNRRWPIDLGDEWRLVPIKEMLNSCDTRNERSREVGKRCRADDHQQGDAIAHDGIAFVRLVADAAIVGEGNLAALADRLQPRLVRRVMRKMIGVPLDR